MNTVLQHYIPIACHTSAFLRSLLLNYKNTIHVKKVQKEKYLSQKHHLTTNYIISLHWVSTKQGSTMPRSTVPRDFSSATTALKRHQQSIAEDRYLSDPHARVHRVFTGSEHSYQRWQWEWPRDQCVTVAQVRTGHSPLVAAYLHWIERRDLAICPHCHSADETVEHLVFQCPAHDHTRRDTWPGDTFTTDPQRLWSYLERIGAVTRPPPPDREWERESME